MQKFYGALYSVEKHNFGQIMDIFEVAPDWDGYRFHGYCWCPEELIPAQ